MKLFKTIMLIPIVRVIFILLGLTVIAPLFYALLVGKIYEEYVPKTWKVITYSAAIIGEIALVAEIVMDRSPTTYVAITSLMLIHCAISSIRFRKEDKRARK